MSARNAHLARAAALFAGLLLAGCKTLTADGGMAFVEQVADAELRKDVVAVRSPEQADEVSARVAALLRKPLTADTAVQIALLNNRGLQAAYNALGIAEAEMVQAHLPPSPTVSIERLSSPLELEIERRIVGNILALATLPARASIAADRFEQAKLRAAEETLRTAAEARRAFYTAVAARQSAAFLDQAKSAAETATKLAQRLGETGAMNKIDQSREYVFYAEITGQLGTARQRMNSEREKLIRTLGLWGHDLKFALPGFLPELPRRPMTSPEIEVAAVERRLDLQAARIEVTALAKTHGLTQASRFVNLVELSGIRKTVKDRETGEKERSRGFEAEIQIPIFDLGETRVRMAEQTYMQAVNRLAEKAVNVRSEARDAYRTYRSAYDIARHYRDEVVPLRKIISDETLLRYNAMLIDVFALLAEARQRINSNMQAIDAQRDFWLASVDLGVAVTGGGGGGGGGSGGGARGGAMASAAAPSGGEAAH
jgi:outer membrane protein TolC